jgi:hypothetical protein
MFSTQEPCLKINIGHLPEKVYPIHTLEIQMKRIVPSINRLTNSCFTLSEACDEGSVADTS